MSSLPADGALDPLCQEAQRALVDGTLEHADPRVRAHAAGCAECRFLGDLSSHLVRPTGSLASAARPSGGPLAAFVEACDRALEAGQPVFSRYRLAERVGAGGQGVVYRAADLEAGEDTVALKLVHCGPGGESGSLEVLHARRVRHEGICRVYHTERHGGVRLIVMEFIDGPSLGTAAARLSAAEKRRAFRQIGDAVHAAHGAGILHLDLKPSNVLLRLGRDAVVTDFGLSISLGADGTGMAAGGTRGYMAPEQERVGEVDRRTDVHALGRILAFLFPRPSRSLRAVVARATAAAPADRYPDVAALLGALDRYRRWRTRSVLLALAAALLAALSVQALLRPAPRGVRAAWREDLWGPDPLPADAWNVAVSRTGRALPSVSVDHPPVGCARNTGDLIDGQTYYQQWEHGYCFHGPMAICITLEALGFCGGLRPEAPLCITVGIPEVVRRLDLTVAQRAQVGTVEGRLGQLEAQSPCDHDDSVVITLDRPRWVFATRAWFREGVPRRMGVDVEENAGGWRQVFQTLENQKFTRRPLTFPGDGQGWSVPVTTDFAPTLARRLRYRVRCEERRPYDASLEGHPVWLYEIEVFSRMARWEAWWRRGLFTGG